MGQKNLINLAKGNNDEKSSKKTENLTPEEERDLKAKQTVNELLQDVKILPSNDDKLLEIENDSKENNGGNEWLSEQVDVLTQENEKLRQETEIAKEDYARIFAENQRLKNNLGVVDEGAIKIKIIELFNELQNNYISMGVNPMTNTPNFVIYFPAFLERMVMFFPFLGDKRKYRI
jgi:hypothetical protein